MLSDVKVALRISASTNVYDDEINDLISAARRDLIVSGLSPQVVNVDTNLDPLIKRAIIVFVKAEFGLENKDSEKYKQSYESLKSRLTMTGDYNV